jgi:hypothetical protein
LEDRRNDERERVDNADHPIGGSAAKEQANGYLHLRGGVAQYGMGSVLPDLWSETPAGVHAG